MLSRHRQVGAAILIVGAIVALSVPFLFQAPPVQPPDGGGNGGGGGGGGQMDREAPKTTIAITGPNQFTRAGVQYFYPNFTITLHGTDNTSLATIVLNDTGTPTKFQVAGTSAEVTIVVKSIGLHELQYYSIDKAGNKEDPHGKKTGVAKPELTDLENSIEDSGIDSDGITNAMTAKIRAAQHQLDAGHDLNSLNALTNQLNALEGKHGLYPQTVLTLLAIISLLLG